jgi:hypothetical protein
MNKRSEPKEVDVLRKMLNTPPVPHVQQTDREKLLENLLRADRRRRRKKAK